MTKSDLMVLKSTKTMDSREIAELLGARHADVFETISTQLPKAGYTAIPYTYIHPQNGQKYQAYKLPFRETMIVVSGYSVELRAKVVDRWMELESKEKTTKNIAVESKQARLALTDQWKEHGANKPHHYINLTRTEYKSLGYGTGVGVHKAEMSKEELARLMTLEAIETLKLIRNPGIKGYYGLRDSVTETGERVDLFIDNLMAAPKSIAQD